MPITLAWKNPEYKILVATFIDQWNLDDYQRMVIDGAEMINAQAHMVHVIYDFTKTVKLPHNFMRAGYYAEQVLPKNQGLVVFVGANILIQAALSMGQRVNFQCTRYVYLASDMDAAFALISEKARELNQKQSG